MRVPTWRFILTGGAICLLTVAGLGLVAAAGAPPPDTQTLLAAPSRLPVGSAAPNRVRTDREIARERLERAHPGPARWLRFARHLVHAEVTVTGRDGELIVLAFDHGTVDAVGGGSLTIAEAGGTSETVTVDDATIVYVGRADGSLDDLTVGDEVFVQSRVDGGTTLAKRILIVRAEAAG